MSAATAEINTPERPGKVTSYPLAAATKLYAGTLAALNSSGNLVAASDAAGLRVVGRVEETVDNSAGSAGDLNANVKNGVFKFNNSGSDAVDANDRGKIAYIEDDNTVCEAGATHKVKAGRIVDVESDGVWIDTSDAFVVPSTFTALAALTSTNGVMAAAADDAAVKVEGEKIGDDVRAVHATVTDIITALQSAGILK